MKVDRETASHACSTCKHSHRRCDRALPICTGCKSKGKKCSYDELPKKPGPKSIHYEEETTVEPLPLPIVKKEIDYYPLDDIPIDTAIDNYFDSICYYTPMFDRTSIHDVFEYRTALREHKLTELETIPSKQDRALLFALQALFYKKIHVPGIDSHSAELSRKMMAGHFDTVLLDNKMACAYLLLGMYYKCENNMERCRFYVNNVNLAIAAWKEHNQLGDLMIEDDPECFRMSFLEVYLKSLTIPDTRENLNMFLKTNLYLNSVIERYNEMYDFGGAYHPGTQFDEYIQPYLGLIKEDIDNKTNRFPIDLKTVDTILTNISKSVEGHNDMNVLTVNRRNILLFAEGVKIQLLLKSGHHTTSLIRSCADRITENAEYSNLCMLQSGYAYPVVLAMQVHLECLAETTNDQERKILVQQLTHNVSLLQSMMSVNKHLETDIGYIVRNVAQSLLKKEANFKTVHEAVAKETEEMYLPMTDSSPDTLETYSTDLILGNDQLMFL